MNPHNEHPDERTVELFVLKSDLLGDRRKELEAHLTRCPGCSAMVAEVEEFYADAGRLQTEQEEKAAHALYAPDRAIRPGAFSRDGLAVRQSAPLSKRFVQSVRNYPLRWSAGFAAMTAAILLLPSLLKHDPNPAYARARNEFLLVFNKDGDELWRKHFGWGYDVTAGEGAAVSHPERALTAYDVDGDGTREILAVFGWTDLRDPTAPPANTILCFNADGSERWRYAVHRQVTIGGEAYTDNYRIYQMLVGDFDRNGSSQIVLCVSQDPWFPNVLISLNAKDGAYVSEYWHPGVIRNVVQRDINADGVDELIMAGQNNRYGRACLVVLDPRRITGYAPTPEKYVPSGMPRGQQLYYLIFPPSDLKERWVDITNQVAKLALREGGLVEVAVMEPLYEYNAEIYYYLDSTMACVRVRASDHFTAIHNRYEQQGRFSSSLNDDYFDQLRKDILYWNGRQLVKGRTESMVAERSAAK